MSECKHFVERDMKCVKCIEEKNKDLKKEIKRLKEGINYILYSGEMTDDIRFALIDLRDDDDLLKDK